MPELSERLQELLASTIDQMLGDGEAAAGNREQIEQALRDGADRILQAVPELLQAFQPLNESSLGASPHDRRSEWRTEMHAVMIRSSNAAAGFAVLTDELAKVGMAKADAEAQALRSELVAMRERLAILENLAHQNNRWFTEGADFSRAPGNAEPTLAQTWGELLSMDPDDRLEELQRLLSDGEGRVLR
jgi:hypothetical protein